VEPDWSKGRKTVEWGGKGHSCMLANGRKKFANRMLQLQFAGRIVTGNWDRCLQLDSYFITRTGIKWQTFVFNNF